MFLRSPPKRIGTVIQVSSVKIMEALGAPPYGLDWTKVEERLRLQIVLVGLLALWVERQLRGFLSPPTVEAACSGLLLGLSRLPGALGDNTTHAYKKMRQTYDPMGWEAEEFGLRFLEMIKSLQPAMSDQLNAERGAAAFVAELHGMSGEIQRFGTAYASIG